MAGGLISQSRQAAAGQMAPPDFWSWQNAKKAGQDLITGALPGAIGGAVGGFGSAAYGAIKGAGTAASAGGTLLKSGTTILPGGAQAIPRAGFNAAQQLGQAGTALGPTATGQAPIWGRALTGAMQTGAAAAQRPGVLGQLYAAGTGAVQSYKQINELLKQITPQQQTGQQPTMMQQQHPARASSGPIVNTGGGAGGQSGKQYYSFEKYLGSGTGMRDILPDQAREGLSSDSPLRKDLTAATAPGITQNAPGQAQTDGNPAQEGVGTQEPVDKFRPTSGISQKLYDASKYFEESPWLQGGVGLAATVAAAWASGGISLLGGSAVGAAAGGGSKLLAGQLRQYFSVREQQAAQEAQQNQVQSQVSPQLQPQGA